MQPFKVECALPVCVSPVCMRSAQYYVLHLNSLPSGVVSVAGNGLNAKVNTSDTARCDCCSAEAPPGRISSTGSS
jgi:hypothetical protein